MAVNDKNQQRKKAMITALENTLGVVTTAAKQAGIERTTHYMWLEKDPEYKKQVEDLRAIVLDFGEAHLHKLIKDGDTTATIFLLKTLGKHRGYVERQEFTTADQSFKVEIEVVKGGEDE